MGKNMPVGALRLDVLASYGAAYIGSTSSLSYALVSPVYKLPAYTMGPMDELVVRYYGEQSNDAYMKNYMGKITTNPDGMTGGTLVGSSGGNNAGQIGFSYPINVRNLNSRTRNTVCHTLGIVSSGGWTGPASIDFTVDQYISLMASVSNAAAYVRLTSMYIGIQRGASI